MSLRSSSQARIFSTVSPVSSSSMISPDAFAGGALAAVQWAAEFSPPTLPASMPDLRGRHRLQRLLLGAHDRLQRGVARLVDRVSDGDHGRQSRPGRCRSRTRPGARSAAPPSATSILITCVSEGMPQVLGDDRTDRVALAVVGLLSEQDQVGALALERLRERVPGGGHVRTGQDRVRQVDRAVGAERDGLVQRPHGAVGSHRHRHDLLHGSDSALADLHRGLDRVGVVGVEVLLAAAVHPPRRWGQGAFQPPRPEPPSPGHKSSCSAGLLDLGVWILPLEVD